MIKKRIKKKKLIIKPAPLFYLSIKSTRNNLFMHVKSKKGTFLLNPALIKIKALNNAHTVRETAGKICSWLKKKKMIRGFVVYNGFNKFKYAVFKTLKWNRIRILAFIDKTSIAHNGCRPSKKRRVKKKRKKNKKKK